MVWSKKNEDYLTNTTNPVGGGIRGNKRLTHINQLTLLSKHISQKNQANQTKHKQLNKKLTKQLTNQPTLLSILKNLSLTTLTTSLLLVLTINIYRTYSYTNTLTNAVESINPTQPETTNQTSNNTNTTCNPSNPNAPVCIGFSIVSSTGDDTTSQTNNLGFTIPDGGGIAIGYQTVNVITNTYGGYTVTISISQENSNKVGIGNNLARQNSDGSLDPNNTIASLPIPTNMNANNVSSSDSSILGDNTWGVAIPGITRTHISGSGHGTTYALYPVWLFGSPNETDNYNSKDPSILSNLTFAGVPIYGDNSLTIYDSDFHFPGGCAGTGNCSLNIYYGARVDDTTKKLAGNYQNEIVYTATATPPATPAPEDITVTPTTYELSSGDSPNIKITQGNTIANTAVASAYEVWIDLNRNTNISTNQNVSSDPGEACTNISQVIFNTGISSVAIGITCDIPTQNIQAGTYSIYIKSQAADIIALEDVFTYTTPPAGTVCRNADPYSDCKVDIDENMIPIYYDGNTEDGEAIWKVANPNDTTNPGSWYDYTNKQWANAVTITKEALDAKKYQNPDTTIDNNDVLGYWVYIPRYAYEVQRPNAVDRVVAPQNFNIRFETAGDTKKIPASSCNLGIETAEQMWNEDKPSGDHSTNASNAGPNSDNIKAKDYRTTCVDESNGTITRDYPDNNVELANGHTTWATHPAFSWLDSEGNGTELNGIWVGKFETTGTRTNPTVKPNQHANILEYIGNFYTMAKHIGIYDENNTGGNDITGSNGETLYANNGEWTSLHNLKTTTSHMLKNSEWGAVAYLASSIYGAGINEETGESNVSINSAYPSEGDDADGNSSRYGGITGCGPKDINRSTGSYSSVTTSTGETVNLPTLSSSHIEDPLACGDTAHSYIGNIGILASTTNNIYGIYDMSGGAHEYVMGNLSDNPNETDTNSYFSNPAKPPYVDIYLSTDFDSSKKPDWSAASSEQYYNNDICTWGNCGGHALHETKLYQSVSSFYQSWSGVYSYFAVSSSRWFPRGGFAGGGFNAGLFYSSNSTTASASGADGFRTVLLP